MMTRPGGVAEDIVAVDIGGTHVRYAVATIAAGRVLALCDEQRFKCADDPCFAASWARYAAMLGRPMPSAAAVAVAAPVGKDSIKLVNNAWTLHPSRLPAELRIDRLHLINDFAAVAHAVAHARAGSFRSICGPDVQLPATGTISVIGPGTGLGVAILARSPNRYSVMPSEGGHTSFAVRDAIDEVLAARMRRNYGRASSERVVSGPGLRHIFSVLDDRDPALLTPDDASLWQRAFDGHDDLHTAALDRFSLCLGAFAGDMALAHGATAVVLAGSLANRLLDHSSLSWFQQGFIDKGRFASAMALVPVCLFTESEPGLFGAAAAFAALEPR